MSNLAFDIARCSGTTASICLNCRRREPGRDNWQTIVAPAVTFSSRGQLCHNRIAPDWERAILSNGTETPNTDVTGLAPEKGNQHDDGR